MHLIEPLQDLPPDPAQPTGPHRPLLASYANYFEVGHNAFEFLIDVGQVEPQSGGVQLMNRIAASPVHAKLLAQLLVRSIAQFEAAHHEIPDIAEPETDLAILPPQEFEQRAIDARNKPTLGGQRDEPGPNQR
ncbi:DUF3467 domain-containing protein [Dyella subtropica]|uniref:DUF3467 domain-containing protein n=1 Tax=Dyella subtropica TaxID=2992127 RepID=UPI002253AE4D|nr:DUF3467 domain-containing protein [Dyella subtropica]